METTHNLAALLLDRDSNAFGLHPPSKLMHACYRGNIHELARIAHSSNVNLLSDSGEAPLHVAARKGHRGICLLLMMEYLARPDIRSSDGRLPIDLAAHPDMCTILHPAPRTALQQLTPDSEDLGASVLTASASSLSLPSPPSPMQAARRRRAVSEPQQPPARLTDTDTNQDVVQPALLRLNVFERNLGDVVTIAQRFVREKVSAGTDVILQNRPNDHLYVIERGTFEIWRSEPDCDSFRLGTLDRGMFGEQPLLYEMASPFTARAATDCVVWKLSREDFDALVLPHWPTADATCTDLEATPSLNSVGTRSNDGTEGSCGTPSYETDDDMPGDAETPVAPEAEAHAARPAAAAAQAKSHKRSFIRRMFPLGKSKSKEHAVHGAAPAAAAMPSSHHTSQSSLSPSLSTGSYTGSFTGSTASALSSSSSGSPPNDGRISHEAARGPNDGRIHDPRNPTERPHERPAVQQEKHLTPSKSKSSVFNLFGRKKPVKVETAGDSTLVFRRNGGTSQVFAGTIDRLLQHALHTDDTVFKLDLLLTFRTFMSGADFARWWIASFNEQSQQDTLLTHPQHVILQMLCFWTATKPIAMDPLLSADEAALVILRRFVAGLACQEELLVITLRERVQNRETPPTYGPTPPIKRTKIQVLIAQPLDREATLEFPIEAHFTLGHVLQLVVEHTKQYEDSYFDRESFQFRALGFGSLLHRDINVADANLTCVRLVPIKAFNQAFRLADLIEVDYVTAQLTYLDHQLFTRIVGQRELFHSSAEDAATSPTVYAIAHRFNQITWWCMSLVFGEKTELQRSKIIEKLIDIANECYAVRNYHTSTAIINALVQPAVIRLKKTWALVDRVHLGLFSCIERLVMPESNRGAYRAILRDTVKLEFDQAVPPFTLPMKIANLPCFPFLAVICSDFAFCDIGNKATLPSYMARNMPSPVTEQDKSPLVNFARRRQLARQLLDVIGFQRRAYDVEVLDKLDMEMLPFTEYLFEHVTELTRKESYDMSMALEESSPAMAAPPLPRAAVAAGPAKPMLMYRMVDNYKYQADEEEEDQLDEADLTSTDITGKPTNDKTAAEKRARDLARHVPYQAPRPPVNFIGSFEVKTALPEGEADFRKQITHLLKRSNTPHVYIEVQKHDIVVAQVSNFDVLIKRPIEKIDYYRYDPASKVMFFTMEDSNSGNESGKICHAFHSNTHHAEEAYLIFHRGLERWSRTSLKESDVARRRAMKELINPDHPVPDGAFVLRDSTSRPGSYALSIKQDGKISHILIEAVPGGGVRFKDSDGVFDDLTELIKFHCIYQSGLPCKLTLEGSHIMTKIPVRIATNTLTEDAVKAPVVAPDLKSRQSDTNHWFFPYLSRADAEELLRRYGKGAFLIRRSRDKDGQYALSVYDASSDQNVIHIRIDHDEYGYRIDEGQPCQTMEELVQFLLQESREDHISVQLTHSPIGGVPFDASKLRRAPYDSLAHETSQSPDHPIEEEHDVISEFEEPPPPDSLTRSNTSLSSMVSALNLGPAEPRAAGTAEPHSDVSGATPGPPLSSSTSTATNIVDDTQRKNQRSTLYSPVPSRQSPPPPPPTVSNASRPVSPDQTVPSVPSLTNALRAGIVAPSATRAQSIPESSGSSVMLLHLRQGPGHANGEGDTGESWEMDI
eukprot:m.25789 g.25789  ORF g.25789 m.25789 type:complete len:1646 (-) comp4211_c0_seq1:491-5428(-)